MASLKSSKNFRQTQPITTALRHICESYPENTCLRELLQNADDAGASEIEYVLDTQTYPHSSLLHPDLAQDHGPALLVKNNSIFSDRDLQSLSSVGDSVKRNDPATTGKFGQGFNSVYHWTDGPWVYSRNWLLMLDPHEGWSREAHDVEPGGPTFDVVENHSNPVLQSHLATFSACKVGPGTYLDETIIRLPLRTKAQAKCSKIVTRETTIDTVKQTLELFSEDIEQGGLLFLKNIRRITMRIDDTKVFDAQIDDDPASKSIRDGLPQDFLDSFALPNADPNALSTIRRSFQTKIRFENGRGSWTDSYLMQHMFKPLVGDSQLDSWARENKLFPWVAIAAPLLVRTGPFNGKLFSTLSLHINTQQPVHIHGLFAIAPDRARLGFHKKDVQWNNYMFGSCVAASWADLVSQQASKMPANGSFSLWPRCDITHKTEDPWTSLDDLVLNLIVRSNRKVWPSINGERVSFQHALFLSRDSEEQSYREAWEVIGLPAVILEPALFQAMQRRASLCDAHPKALDSKAARSHLRDSGSELGDTADMVLEYCLLDAMHIKDNIDDIAEDLYDLPIWPMLDGSLHVIQRSTRALLPWDLFEMKLFLPSRASSTISLGRLTSKTTDFLKHQIANKYDLLRLRDLDDLEVDWPSIYTAGKSSEISTDISERDKDHDSQLRNVWTWICDKSNKQPPHVPGSMNDLWLLPMRDNDVRRLASAHKDRMALILDEGSSLEDLVPAFPTKPKGTAPALLDTSALSTPAIKFLKDLAVQNPDLGIADSEDLPSLVQWLLHNKAFLRKITEMNMVQLLGHIERLVRTQRHKTNLGSISTIVRQLPLFTRSYSKTPYTSRLSLRSEIGQENDAFHLPPSFPALPDLPRLVFFAIKEKTEHSIVQQFQLVSQASNKALLENHLLPWIVKPKSSDELFSQLQLIDWIFERVEPSDKETRTLIADNPVIPVGHISSPQKFRCLRDLVDPEAEHASLYFDDELIFPSNGFFEKHKRALRSYGISKGNESPDLPLDRAKVYAGRKADQNLLAKVEKLCALSPTSSTMNATNKSIQLLKWLPATMPNGEMKLCSPNACRGFDQRDLVDGVWGWLPCNTSRKWKSILGWDKDIPCDILIKQLDCCIEQADKVKLGKVLKALSPKDYSRLTQKACIQGQHGELMVPSQVFYPGDHLSASSLLPCIDCVDSHFARDHKSIISSLEIAREPSLIDIQKLQATLNSRCPLDASGISLAIASLEVALRLPDFDRAKLAIPDTLGHMRSLTEIVHGEPVVEGQLAEFHYTNSRVSNDLIHRLELESCYERATRLDIEIEDEDDEYAQSEDPKDTILDTLGRYPIDATFSEFLANADDAGAEQICWTIDNGSRKPLESESSLTAELKDLNGPSIIVYNDATFSEKDFLGFKRFGQGGKKADATTTGMFGRGGMTMYHFTDVPMVLSAGYLIILDPLQTCLPRNKHMVRKRGQKLSLQKARKLAGAQLALFEGLHGFSADTDYYEGTMFRLPLRQPGIRTKFNRYSQHVDCPKVDSLLTEYMSTARQSLLFLPNIRSIEVRIKGVQTSSWRVSIQRAQEWEHETFNSAIICVVQSDKKPYYDLWRIGLKEVESCPAHIRKVGKGVSKVTECGVAACIQSAQSVSPGLHGKYIDTAHSARTNAPQHKVHCKLPLTIQSQLPITFHASFAITGDRKTIAIEGQDDLSAWNLWLLTECVADFYIEFLVNAAPKYGAETFDLWPYKSKHKLEASNLSRTVADTFWIKIGQEGHLRDHLYPLVCNEPQFADTGLNDLRRPRTRTLRVIHRAVSLADAHFDFLSESNSRELGPLFHKMALNIVRPPGSLRIYIKAATKMQGLIEVGPAILSQIFKDESKVLMLENHLAGLTDKQAKATFFAALLNNLVPSIDDGNPVALHILDGCRIVPRPDLNNPLGTLRFNQPQNVAFHLVASQTERALFPSAAYHFVNEECLKPSIAIGHNILKPRDYLNDLRQSGANIRLIDNGDLGFLFEMQHSQFNTNASTDVRAEWMTALWKYLDRKLGTFALEKVGNTAQTTVKEFLTKANLWNKPLYRLCRSKSGNVEFISPAEFDIGPYIVNPSDQVQHQLCAEIPGLSSVYPAFMPSSLAKSEESLESDSSFERLLKALDLLLQNNSSIDATLDSVLSGNSRQVLMGIMLQYVRSHSSTGLIRHSALLRRLPLWPRARPRLGQTEPGFIALSNAQVCEYSALFVSWVKDMDTFIEPNTVARYKHEIESLGAKSSDTLTIWNRIKSALPTKLLDTSARKEHVRLLSTLNSNKVKVMNERVAPNGHGVLCKPSDFYNHKNGIFWHAFQFEQEDHFVHPDFRHNNLRLFFFNNGLRTLQNGTLVRQEDFLECALAIARAFQESVPWEAYERAASPVASYLQYEIEDFHRWSPDNWQRISKIPLFRVCQQFGDQPVYRQSRMEELAKGKRYCPLTEAARLADIRISWSQYKVLENSPADFVFKQRQKGGGPSLHDVYEHLKYLTSFHENVQPDEIPEYLKDVQACYDYMQKCAVNVKLLPNIRNARVWFNLDSTATETIAKEQLTNKLFPAQLLCLDAPCDTTLMKRTRKFLAPYESLLTSLGCPAFAQPPRPAPRASLGGIPLSLGTAMHGLRDQGLLVDVCFSAEGINVQAHRVVLAAVSDYCKAQFSGKWALLGTPIPFQYGCGKLSTLSVLVNSAYGVAYQGPTLRNAEDTDEIANSLDDILDVLVCANAWQMRGLRDVVEDFLLEDASIYRRADNVEEVKRIAIESNASRLAEDCIEYMKLNKDALERLNRS